MYATCFLLDSNPMKLVTAPGKVYYIDEAKSSIMRLRTSTEDTEAADTQSADTGAEVVVDNVFQPKALTVDIEEG